MSFLRDVRIGFSENQQHFALDFAGCLQRTGILVLTQSAVVNSCPIEADRRTHIWLERGTKRQVAPDAKSSRAKFARRHQWMLRQIIEHCAAVSIKICHRRFGSVSQSARAAGVIELEYRSGTLDTVVYLRRSDYESVSRKAHAGAQHWSRELKDVRVEDDAGILALGFRSRRS